MVNTSPRVHHKLIKRTGCLCAIHIITTFDHHEIFGSTQSSAAWGRNTEMWLQKYRNMLQTSLHSQSTPETPLLVGLVNHQKKAPRRHPDQMPELPQLARLCKLTHHFLRRFLSSLAFLSSERSHPVKEIHFDHLYMWPHSSGHYASSWNRWGLECSISAIKSH